MTSELMMAAQATSQLNVRLREANRAMKKNAAIGIAGMSQVRVVRSCAFIGSS